MIGLEAISEHNGWAMAVTGIIIVMLGLSVLAFIISQLHKIIGLFEEKKKGVQHAAESAADIDTLNEPGAAALMYQPFTADLGDSFPLAELYRILEEKKQPHPHLTINTLRQAGYLQPEGNGLFSWKKD